MAEHETYGVEQITAANLDKYLALAGGDTEENRASYQERIGSKPQYVSLVLMQGAVPLARFTIERYGLGLTTWSPLFKEGLTSAERDAGRRFIAGALHGILRRENLPFVESCLESDKEQDRVWRDALLASGFETVSLAQEWTRRVPSEENCAVSTMPGLTFSTHQPPDQEVLSCLAATKVGSLDRSHRFEARYGASVTDYDSAVLARHEGRAVGVCGLLFDKSTTIWIKDIGVLEGMRGRGIGGALLGAALRECGRLGKSLVRALIDEENEPSVRLHRAWGFEKLPGDKETLCLEAEPVRGDRI